MKEKDDEKKTEEISFNFYGIKIPLTDALVKAIEEHIIVKVREILDKEDLIDILANKIGSHNKYHTEVLQPIVRSILDDMELRAKIYWFDDD